MSNTTCDNISHIFEVSPVKYYNSYTYNYNHFELFLATIITLMPISKKYSQYITIDVMRRKINQYTNWNILMILANSALFNIFSIDNHLLLLIHCKLCHYSICLYYMIAIFCSTQWMLCLLS